MSVVSKFPVKQKHQKPITHIVRADLLSLAVLYHLHVKHDSAVAQNLLTAFTTQVMYTAAIKVNREQYEAFKEATADIAMVVNAAYGAYLNEANSKH